MSDSACINSMFPQYRCIPQLPAPTFMANLNKMKFAKIADIRNNEFECVFGNLLLAKSRHCFHILFYTYFNENKRKFVCIDKTDGAIYWISYDEDHTEGSTYVIDKSKRLTYQEFMEVLNKYEKNLPGIVSTFKSLSSDNWENYLNISYDKSNV